MIVESPIVENYQRNLIFPDIFWLNKTEFIDSTKNEDKLYPYVSNIISNEKLFIGKNILYLTNNTKNVFIGFISSNDNDIIKIATSDKKVIIHNDYHILSITDSNSFCWIEKNNDLIPNYALRACLNYNLFEYFYIGRTFDKYLGNISRSDGLLYICNEINEAQSFDKYEILCLKPSPASLKQLSRILIRSIMNKNVSILDGYLPKSLVDYIKYPSYISNGDCLLKNEKLVSENGVHELKITVDSKLVYQSFNKTRILYDFVDSIWTNRYFSVINRFDNAFVYFLYLLSTDDINEEEIKLKLTDNGQLILHQGERTFKKYFISQ
jgi:hypothetical protein